MRKFLPIFTAILGIPLFALLLSNVLMHVGDKAFLADRLRNAQLFYSAAHSVNPFNPDIANRLLAANVNLEERLHESEETANSEKNIAQVIQPHNVLGLTSCIPVLMYHYIRINPWPTDTVGFGLSTHPQAFAQQLDYLQKQGYQTITIATLESIMQLHRAMERKATNSNVILPHAPILPSKPLLITLDDGYEDAYTQALPILQNHHMHAVEFVITGFVGLPNYLTWPEISRMDSSGTFDIESHTVHHYALGGTFWNNQTVMYEMAQSKNDLQTHLKKRVGWFAYPYGSVNEQAASDAAKLYFGAFGTNFGAYQATDIEYTLPRIRVSGGDWGPSIEGRIISALQETRCIQ